MKTGKGSAAYLEREVTGLYPILIIHITFQVTRNMQDGELDADQGRWLDTGQNSIVEVELEYKANPEKNGDLVNM